MATRIQGVSELRDALQNKSLTGLTQALSKVAESLTYQLRPPYTEILQFKAKETAKRFTVHFRARLHLHYSSLGTSHEGLVFTIEFGGNAFADIPTPPMDDLFYAGRVRSFRVYGYGSRWVGEKILTPRDLRLNLEIPTEAINAIDVEAFLATVSGRR